MGCVHSNANGVIVDPTTQPPSGYGKVSMDIVFTDIIVDETSTSVPLVEEDVEEYEKEVIVTTSAPEDEPTPTEEPVMAEEPVVVKEPVMAEESVAIEAPLVYEEPVVVEEPVVYEEPIVVEESIAVEAGVMEKLTVEEEEALVEDEAEEEVELHEEESLVLEELAVTSTSAPAWTFVAEKVTFTVGVAYFNISGFNPDGDEVYLTKRYSEFKVLHAEMAKLMSKEELLDLPGTSFLQGRNDKALLQEREDAFVKMLNAIAQHPESFESVAFTAFLA